jgi:hypothetical protein
MNHTLVDALRSTGLGTLAEAYLGSLERLQGVDIENFQISTEQTLSNMQLCCLEIVRSSGLLLPFLTRETETKDGYKLGVITILEIIRLNESASQILETFTENTSTRSWPKFDPEFELSLLIRQSVLLRSEISV